MESDLPSTLAAASRLVHAGSGREGPVGPPIVRASTILHPSVGAMREAEQRRAAGERVTTYGRRGTRTGYVLEDALTELEGGHATRLTASGLAANALVFLAMLRCGDHVLVSDGVYGPVRRFVRTVLPRMGVEFDFIAADGSDLAGRLRRRTRLVYLEAPGSVLYEVPDLPRIAATAHAHGARVAVDSTWSSGWASHPLALGADLCILAATKYLGGHSDLLLGAVVSNEACWAEIDSAAECHGSHASPPDAYLVLRGLRTLGVRMQAHARGAEELMAWVARQPWGGCIYSPVRPDHPGHAVWQRDYRGGCGLFSVGFPAGSDVQVEAFVDRLRLFGIGASWGGFESLARVEHGPGLRSVGPAPPGPVVRFHVGLEEPADLIDDLAQAATALDGLAAPESPGVSP